MLAVTTRISSDTELRPFEYITDPPRYGGSSRQLESRVNLKHAKHKRKRSYSQVDESRVRRHVGKSQTGETSVAATPLALILSLPTEIIILVVRNLCDRDLLRLTQVNRYMADRTCELYMARRNIRLVDQSVSMRGVGFEVLSISVWRRSSVFKGRRSIMCWFDSEPAEAESQVHDLKMLFATLPAEPICHTIHLRYLAPVNPERLLSLLESINRSGISHVEVHAHMTSHQSINFTPIPSCIYLHATKTIQLRFADLSVVNWALLLKHIVAPSLEKIVIEGGASTSTMSQFLRRHHHVSAVEFSRASNPRHHLHASNHPLHLPALHTLSGMLYQVLPLLDSFSSPPELAGLHLKSVTELPYWTWISEVMRCVALCTGIGQLTIGFTPSPQFSSDDRIVYSGRRHRKLKYMPTSVLKLTIEVKCLSDKAILACCDHWMTLLGGLSNIVVRKMRETGKASTLYGDVSRSQTGLLEVAWRKPSAL